ncbi:GrpB family protein [Sciscionella marina]|uniref:GrpB family protein n=1 Tax=Sciscionella marina TaxID=508770 RepID=UPI0003755306|nr:GrpB family protein [Sciscionella marina]
MAFEDVVVGEARPYADKVVIEEYDPSWPDRYRALADQLHAVLGDTLRLVAHKGSTSVPGLAAKPIIDLVAAVAESAAEPSYVPALEAVGYRLRVREPGWYEHRMLRKRIVDGADENAHLHVYTEGCPEITKNLAFRDWLRAHPEDRDRYAEVKRELAKREWRYMQDYAEAKTEIIEGIITKARAAGVDIPA